MSDFFSGYFRAWETHDLDGVLAYYAEDIAFEDTVVGAKAVGLDQMRRFVRDAFGRVPDARFDLVTSFTTETDYCVEWVMQPMGVRGLSIGKRRADGKIVAQRDYWNGAIFQVPSHAPAVALTADDRVELHDLAARYGNTIDERDWERFRTVFTVDCRYELRNFGRKLDTVLHGLDALTQMMIDSTSHPLAHHVTNVEVDVRPDGRVRMRSKIIGTSPAGTSGSGDYDDIVVRTPDGWRIADRTVTLRRPPREV